MRNVANSSSNRPSARPHSSMRLSLILCTSSGNASMSMDDGGMHNLTRCVKRLFTCLEGLRDSSLEILAWICIILAMKTSDGRLIWASKLKFWKEAINGDDLLIVLHDVVFES